MLRSINKYLGSAKVKKKMFPIVYNFKELPRGTAHFFFSISSLYC